MTTVKNVQKKIKIALKKNFARELKKYIEN